MTERPGAIAAGRTELAEYARTLADGPAPLLVVTDFDGTLAPITMEPTATRIVPAARLALRSLARTAARRPDRLRLVVLSGRSAHDVAGRIRVGGFAYLGNHGLEGGTLGRRGRAERLAVAADPTLLPYVPRARALGEAVAAALGRPDWLLVEEKGPSVAFHFRQAPDPDAARLHLLAAIESAERTIGEHGLVAVAGRMVIEFRPGVAGGKGEAVRRLLERERPGTVLAMGDDVSDAEGFAALREARDAGSVEGLAVAVHGAAETPPTVLANADIVLASPVEAARFLRILAGLLAVEAD
jgi:trehalose 6-phosphate phosphatase